MLSSINIFEAAGAVGLNGAALLFRTVELGKSAEL